MEVTVKRNHFTDWGNHEVVMSLCVSVKYLKLVAEDAVSRYTGAQGYRHAPRPGRLVKLQSWSPP